MVYIIQDGTSWSCSQAVSKTVWHTSIPLLCVQWKTPGDGRRNCPKHVDFYSKNKFEKLVHLVGFIIRFSHDARSPERQTLLQIRVFQHWNLTSEGGCRHRDFLYFFFSATFPWQLLGKHLTLYFELNSISRSGLYCDHSRLRPNKILMQDCIPTPRRSWGLHSSRAAVRKLFDSRSPF